MPSLLKRYERELQHGFVPDSQQQSAIEALETLRLQLVRRYEQARSRGVFHRFLNQRHMLPVQGLYLWGGVGRGKTWLMDLFFESLPFRRKLRSHFNRFMQRIHKELRLLTGSADPLEQLADRLAKEAVVICFDEFYVMDITDAMLLGMLFKALFDRGVCLVATSNSPPERLYEKGLQRERFLPAIERLKAHCTVMQIDSGLDYRLRHLVKMPLFYTPLNAESADALCDCWKSLTGVAVQATMLTINERPMQALAATATVLWLDYHVLCEEMRSQNDYIELSRRYPQVIVQNVSVMDADHENEARRFINLIDEFYDRGVKLIMSAAVPMEQLYQGKKLQFEFRRTLSRLTEMQSQAYLEVPFKP